MKDIKYCCFCGKKLKDKKEYDECPKCKAQLHQYEPNYIYIMDDGS